MELLSEAVICSGQLLHACIGSQTRAPLSNTNDGETAVSNHRLLAPYHCCNKHSRPCFASFLHSSSFPRRSYDPHSGAVYHYQR